MGVVVINRKGEASIKFFRHPWVYRSSIKDIVGDIKNGSVVRIVSEDKTLLGWGFYSEKSLIALRIFDFSGSELPENWIEEKIESAYRLRKTLNLGSNAYRLVNSEGDLFPGLIVDIYNSSIVVKPQVRGVECILDRIVDTLEKKFPGFSVYLKRDERAARVEGLNKLSGYLCGEGDGTEIIEEQGIKFVVDYARGQKTGFYLDQRDNRRIMLEISNGKRVLNLFAYTGGFSLYSVRGGAIDVDSVESSEYALELSKRNLKLNQSNSLWRDSKQVSVEWIRADAMHFVSEIDDGYYDIIILDPPPFARRRRELKGAVKGYSELNYRAIRKIKGGGFILTFSCSGVVSRDVFREIILKQGVRAKREVRILKELHPPPDHPTYLFHSEGEYLKGFLLYVE